MTTPTCNSDADDTEIDSNFDVEDVIDALMTNSVGDSKQPKAVGELTEDGTANGSDSGSKGWGSRTDFTADSPYFDAFVHSEMKNLDLLSETLQDISNRTKAFCYAGMLMSDATQNLALSCRLRRERDAEDIQNNQYGSNSSGDAESDDKNRVDEDELAEERREAVGEEMAGILELLGEVRSRSGRGHAGIVVS
jgi:hypothetical protein